MHARAAILIGLAAFAGVAYASSRRGGGRVDAPDPVGLWGDWGPVPLFEDAADAITGVVMNHQVLSVYGLESIKAFEGFSATPYPDHKGYSIGFGHLIKAGEDLSYITREQGEQLLLADVEWAERAVRTAVSAPLTAGQFDALVSFAYNVGEGAFRSSTMVRKLNAGDFAGALAEFPRWVRASGEVNDALVARRRKEQAIFEA